MERLSYFKGTAIIAFFELLVRLKGLIIIPLLTYHFQSYHYGIWSQVLVFVLFLQPLMGFIVEEGFVRKAAGKSLNTQESIFTASVLFSVVNGLFIVLIIWLNADYLSQLFMGEKGIYSTYLVIGVLDIYCISLINLHKNWFLTQKKSFIYAFGNFIQGFLNILSALAVFFLDQGVLELVQYKVLSDFLTLAFLASHYLWKYKFRSPDFKALWGCLKYSIQVVPMLFITWGIDSLDRFFILNYQSFDTVGIYALAYGIGTMIILMISVPFWSTYTSLMTIHYNQSDPARMQQHLNDSAGTMLAILSPAVVGIFLTADYIVGFFSPAEFAEAGSILGIISLSYMLYMLSSFFKVMLDLRVGPYIQVGVYGVALACNVVLNYLLVPLYSIQGAAIATLVCFTVALSLNYFLSRTYARLGTVNFKFVFKVILAAGLMGLVSLIVKNQISAIIESSIVQFLLVTMFGVLSYALFLHLLKAIKYKQLINGLRHLFDKPETNTVE